MRKLVVLAVICVPTVAAAHIAMTYPARRTNEQKEEHCGLVAAPRGNVSTFLPGQTITVTWNETISHPGWYRISFQPDGSLFEIPPASDGPYGDGSPGGNFPTEDLTGMTDPATGSMILLDRIHDNPGTGPYSQEITLPNIECDNCTLQLIQVMTSAHGPYDEPGGNDIYFQCADMILSATAPDAAPAPPDAAPGTPDGGVGQDAGNPAMGNGGGCCSVTGGPSGILTALAMVGLLRRRRPRR